MLNPQELRDKTFEKAVFGGYDMAAVDDFLSEVSDDYTSLYKEVSVLKAKMKVLVDKIEEYRGSEVALNRTLLTAQRVGAEIEEEAREKSESMVKEAKAAAFKITGAIQAERELEENRLFQAKSASAEFIEKMRLICSKQLDFLDTLGEMKLVPPPKAVKEAPAEESFADDDYSDFDDFADDTDASGDWDTVRSIEDSVAKLSDDPEIEVPTDADYSVQDNSEPTRLFDLSEDTASRPKFNFENLRFGQSYDEEK